VGAGVPAATEFLVGETGSGIALGMGAGGVVDGVAEPGVNGAAHTDSALIAALLGDRGGAGEGAKGVVVSLFEGLRGLGEHRGDGNGTDSWDGVKDLDVTVLALLWVRRGFGEGGNEVFTPALAGGELGVGGLELGDGEGDVAADAREGAGSERELGSAEDAEEVIGGQAADAVALEEGLDPGLAEGALVVGGGCDGEEVPEPGFVGRWGECEEGGSGAKEVFAEAVGGLAEDGLEFVLGAAGLAEFDGEGVEGVEFAEEVEVGAEGVGEDVGVAAVILGAGEGVAVAEAVELLGVDGEDAALALEEEFDERAVGGFEGDEDTGGVAGLGDEELDEVEEAVGGMLDGEAFEDAAGRVEETGAVLPGGEVDADEQGERVHGHGSSWRDVGYLVAASTCRPLYWHSKCWLPTGRRRRGRPRAGAGPSLSAGCAGTKRQLRTRRPGLTNYLLHE
jgi:hypothetical protein